MCGSVHNLKQPWREQEPEQLSDGVQLYQCKCVFADP